jgi:nucleoside-diphosphate-sugar epimerase
VEALVIGGTGPTGPAVVRGLLDRGYDVTIYHRGYHETDELPPVQHMHGDPDSREALERDLGGRTWDVVCSMYGRLRYIADAVAGRCERFIAIGGIAGNVAPRLLPFPEGHALPISEDHPRYRERSPEQEMGWAVAETERGVLVHHGRGDYCATILRYTGLYGPRVPRQWLWPIVRRVLDGRHWLVVPGDGATLRPICYTENAAHQVLLAVDRKEAHGQVFHSVDQKTFSLKDIVRLVAEALGHDLEAVQISHPLANDLAMSYGEGPSMLLDSSKLTYVLGYSDLVPPDEGIRRTARWLREHRAELDEDQLASLVPNPYAYEIEDRLIASFKAWRDETQSLPRPELRPTVSAGFRAGYRPA